MSNLEQNKPHSSINDYFIITILFIVTGVILTLLFN